MFRFCDFVLLPVLLRVNAVLLRQLLGDDIYSGSLKGNDLRIT